MTAVLPGLTAVENVACRGTSTASGRGWRTALPAPR
jgi:hypothetical protein